MTLNELNFQKLIDYSCSNVVEYTFDDYRKNGYQHPPVKSFCTACDEIGINLCDDPDYRLYNISHGSHSRDFLSAGSIMESENWNDAGVMFVMESPSKDYGIYETAEIKKENTSYRKRPAKQWYWIHGDKEMRGYPDKFRGGEYGEFVASAIVTFQLRNAYMTNLVKCGLNHIQKDAYKGIDSYNPDCIKCCYERFLKEEIAIIKPNVIFTFGTKVYKLVNSLLTEDIKVVGLPHPAGQRRGFKDEYYNVLYFCMIAKWLLKTGVITKDFYSMLMLRFAEMD